MILILFNYITIILFIILKGFYKSTPFLFKKNNKNILITYIQIESAPFYFNMWRINLFIYLFFTFSCILISVFTENLTFCQEEVFNEDSRSIAYFENNTKIIKQDYKNCSNFYEVLFEKYSNKQNLPKRYIYLKYSKYASDDYLDRHRMERQNRNMMEIYKNFGTNKYEFRNKVLGPGTTKDDFVYSFTDRKFIKQILYFKKSVYNFSNYDMLKTTDPFKNFKEISNFLIKAPTMCNNLVIDTLINKYRRELDSYPLYPDPDIKVYPNEISHILKEELPPLYKTTLKYINDHIFKIIDKEKSPNFYLSLIYISNMYKISFECINLLDSIVDIKGDLFSFKKKFNKLDEFIYKPENNEFISSSDSFFSSSSESENEKKIQISNKRSIINDNNFSIKRKKNKLF